MKKIAVVDPNDATQFYATAAVGLKSRSQVVIFECHTCSGNWLLLLENETQQSSGFQARRNGFSKLKGDAVNEILF